jgi:hypothetical protein
VAPPSGIKALSAPPKVPVILEADVIGLIVPDRIALSIDLAENLEADRRRMA